MSESAKNKKTARFPRIGLFITILAIFVGILGFGYAGGYFILPGLVEYAYVDKDCESAFSLGNFYSSIYPLAESKNQHGQLMECSIYTYAVNAESNKAWRNAYDAYKVYLDTYPGGLFIDEARQGSIDVLVELARDDIEQTKYDQARDKLTFILNSEKDNNIVQNTGKLMSELYQAWGRNLRDEGDFSSAVRVYGEFATWAQNAHKNEDAALAREELVQTYIGWGTALQSENQFQDSLVKYEQAKNAVPESTANNDLLDEVRDKQIGLYAQWGNYLIDQKNFAEAMEMYGIVAAMSESGGSTGTKDILAKGFVQWAAETINAEDFHGALVLLNFAESNAVTDETRALVEDTRNYLYDAFSKSSGEQAQKAIQDAVRIVCEHHVPPGLPIFGLDKENMRAGVYGTDGQLLESIAAKTPASLKYIACIEEDYRVADTLTLPISQTMFGGPPGVLQITYTNYQYIWNVTLRIIDTGEEKSASVIEGVKPEPLIPYTIDVGTFSYYGSKPKISDLVDWILTVIN